MKVMKISRPFEEVEMQEGENLNIYRRYHSHTWLYLTTEQNWIRCSQNYAIQLEEAYQKAQK